MWFGRIEADCSQYVSVHPQRRTAAVFNLEQERKRIQRRKSGVKPSRQRRTESRSQRLVIRRRELLRDRFETFRWIRHVWRTRTRNSIFLKNFLG